VAFGTLDVEDMYGLRASAAILSAWSRIAVVALET
jgi:hypothetical protein